MPLLCCQAHASCYKLLPDECSFGCLREIILPPYALTVPRIDVQQEMLFRFPKKPGSYVSCLNSITYIVIQKVKCTNVIGQRLHHVICNRICH